jgi:ribulose-5-phosphate 4-epimerase/fuculose-1-phosphate aldolase
MQKVHALRCQLAAAYQIIAKRGWDDLTYTHLSARLPHSNSFFIYPFGLLFKEVTASSLLEVSLEGAVLSGNEYQYNQTGYVIHGSIYRKRPDLNAIFHLHTPAGVAISSLKEGLLPISQWALHFYNRVSYHDYHSLALKAEEHEQQLIQDLAQNKVMLLRNHGSITCGETIQEALFYSHHLEQACRTQCLIGSQKELVLPSAEICAKACQDLLGFEKNLGERDWQALLRDLEKTGSNYRA